MKSVAEYLLTTGISALVMSVVLVACGSTSAIKPSRTAEAVVASPAPQHDVATAADLSGYDKVVVLDYVDATDKSSLSAAKAHLLSDEVATADRSFADLIANKLRDTGAFHEVVRGPSPGRALVVSGHITRLVDGNGAMRFFVGMGAGSSYFSATTDLSDAESGQLLAQVTTAKNSWALGGGFAAAQTVDGFMQGAAGKIAADLRDSKRGTSVVKAKSNP